MESRVKRVKRNSAATPTPPPVKQLDYSTEQSGRSPEDNPHADSNSISEFRLARASVIPAPSIKLVWLHEWWLTKAEGKGLGIAGFENRGRVGIRIFHSGAIAKRVDVTTLQTADGITVKLSGLINRNRTHDNGFPFQVCHHFLFGFPYYWKDYTSQLCPAKPMSLDSSESLDDIPVSRLRDHLMSPSGGSERNILDHVLSTLSGKASNITSGMNRSRSPVTIVRREGLRSQPEATVPTRGVATRSMTRLESLSKKSK